MQKPIRLIPGLAVAAALLLSPAWAGEVTGHVKVTSTLTTRAEGPRYLGEDRRYASEVNHYAQSGARPDRHDGPSADDLQKQDEVENVVIELIDPQNRLPLTPLKTPVEGRNIMAQKNKNFVPHVVVVPKGSTVYFRNDDRILHHIYTVNKDVDKFEIPEHRHGTKPQSFSQVGSLELFCGLHPRMNGYVYRSQSNFATKPSASHEFRLSDVPPGKYRVQVWHPRIKAAKILEVTVPAQGKVTLDIAL